MAQARGVAWESLIVDPGPDFAKTPAETIAVLRRLDEVVALGRPVLLAVSRKDFVGALTLRRPKERDAGTLAAIGAGVDAGGSILRVHDVAAVADYLTVRAALRGERPVPADLHLPVELRREPPRLTRPAERPGTSVGPGPQRGRDLVAGGLPRLHPGAGGPALGGGHDGVGGTTVDRFADQVGVAGVAGDLLDDVQEDPAHRPGVEVLRVPRHALGHRDGLAEVGDAGHHPVGLGGDLVVERRGRRRWSRPGPSRKPST